MGKAAPDTSAEVRTGKRDKRTTYLIAVRQKREAIRVYAVIASTAEAAVTQLEALTIDRMELEVVGALSRDLTRRLGLEPGEMRLI